MFQSKGDTRSNLSRMESCLPRPHCRWHRIVWRSQRQHTRWDGRGGRGGRNQKLFPPTSRFTGSLFSEELQLAGNEPQIANRVSLLQKRSGHVKFGAIQSQVVSFRLVVNIYRDISLLAKSNQSLIIKNHNLSTIMVKSHDLSFSLLEFPPSPPAHACGEIEILKELFFYQTQTLGRAFLRNHLRFQPAERPVWSHYINFRFEWMNITLRHKQYSKTSNSFDLVKVGQ